MRASVVIPTYNGRDKFPDLLQGLAKQTVKDFETILVIDGSKDDSEQIAKGRDWGLQDFKVIVQQNKGRAGTRNTGAAAAKTNILIFLDDDIILYEDTIAKHIAAQQEHDTVVGILEPHNVDSTKEFEHFSAYLNDKWNQESFYKSSGEVIYITANNFSIKKSVFDSINGFNAQLRDAEDFDLALRLIDAGHKIYLDDKIHVGHILQGTFAKYFKRTKEYGKAREHLIQLNPKAAEIFGRNTHSIAPYKKPFFYIFSLKMWAHLADREMLGFIPRKVRFKMYDLMLTANSIF
ncbi:MAG: glycosyltransferase family 2 protein [Sphingobacteriales bacterium]|nr:MAG: glycosyltransferase family 2 protein [Sphingobacteriales bacterium]